MKQGGVRKVGSGSGGAGKIAVFRDEVAGAGTGEGGSVDVIPTHIPAVAPAGFTPFRDEVRSFSFSFTPKIYTNRCH
jgi:hypothetical protein